MTYVTTAMTGDMNDAEGAVQREETAAEISSGKLVSFTTPIAADEEPFSGETFAGSSPLQDGERTLFCRGRRC